LELAELLGPDGQLVPGLVELALQIGHLRLHRPDPSLGLALHQVAIRHELLDDLPPVAEQALGEIHGVFGHSESPPAAVSGSSGPSPPMRAVHADVRSSLILGSPVHRGQPTVATLSSWMSDTVLEFNPFLPEVHSDPYPAYAQLRELDPVHKGMFPGVWILTRYADCLQILRDPRFSSDSRKSELFELFREMVGQQSPGLLEENRARSMLFVDPPDHTRLRILVNKAFTPRVVESLRPHMQDIVDELLTAVLEAGSGTMDVVADLAYPLPIRVICEMLGVPPEDREVFRQWSSDLVVSLDPDHLGRAVRTGQSGG